MNLDLELSRSELAAMVGLSPETAMRLLSEFKADGLLRLEGRHITILSRDKLAALASL